MKIYLAVALLASVASTPALAQPVDDWSGPYVGAQVGYGTGSSDADATLSGAWTTVESAELRNFVTDHISTDLEPKGVGFGGFAGYNFQTGSGVFGVEGGFTWLNLDDDRLSTADFSPSLEYTAGNNIDAKRMLSLKGKAGVAMGNSLLYVTGGWAWVKARYETSLESDGGYDKAASVSETTDGFIVGAGLEHKFNPNASVRLDYAFTDQSDVNFANAYLPGSTFTSPVYTESFEQDLRLHLISVGVSFHF